MSYDSDVGRFLGMVGGLICCSQTGKFLVLKRSKGKDFSSETWECGTGRVDQGENFSQALLREVKEELGVEVRMTYILGTTHFYRGEIVPENEMLGVFFLCALDDPSAIELSWEHSEYRWVTQAEAESFLPENNWLLNLIKRANCIHSMVPQGLMEYNLEEGFEL